MNKKNTEDDLEDYIPDTEDKYLDDNGDPEEIDFEKKFLDIDN